MADPRHGTNGWFCQLCDWIHRASTGLRFKFGPPSGDLHNGSARAAGRGAGRDYLVCATARPTDTEARAAMVGWRLGRRAFLHLGIHNCGDWLGCHRRSARSRQLCRKLVLRVLREASRLGSSIEAVHSNWRGAHALVVDLSAAGSCFCRRRSLCFLPRSEVRCQQERAGIKGVSVHAVRALARRSRRCRMRYSRRAHEQ